MKIRHDMQIEDDFEQKNSFIAYDEIDRPIGSCRLEIAMRPVLYPDAPMRIEIKTQGAPQCYDALIGAATARALLLVHTEYANMPGRIFTQCPIQNEERLLTLSNLGFDQTDALVRTRRLLNRGPVVGKLPRGCTIVQDYLNDELERNYFLERCQALLGGAYDANWLKELRAKPLFTRILMAAPDGLAGELISYSEGNAGVVELVYASPEWRHQGVATYLMEVARQWWLRNGLSEARFDIQLGLPYASDLAAGAGYRRGETLLCYPGIAL